MEQEDLPEGEVPSTVIPHEPEGEYEVYVVDPVRYEQLTWLAQAAGEDPDEAGVFSGIFCRAKLNGKWGSYDIVTLDKDSFTRFLLSRGPVSDWATSIAVALAGFER